MEEQRRMRILLNLPAFVTTQIRIHHGTTMIQAFEKQHPRRRLPIGAAGRQSRRVRIGPT